jgi:DNA-binding MarR family transcriptional regulator
MGELLKRLERAGLVRRTQHRSDGRRRKVQLSPKGTRLASIGLAALGATDAIATRRISSPDVAYLFSALKCVVKNLDASVPEQDDKPSEPGRIGCRPRSAP